VSEALSWLISASTYNPELAASLPDCRETGPEKLDVRLSDRTFEALRTACGRAGLPMCVYIRRVLFHYSVTNTVRVIKAEGHYTLAKKHHEQT
jgi:hypothetical protein